MRSNYGQKSLLVAVQFGKGHICFTKLFLFKMSCEVSGWRFLKFWFFYAGFYCSRSVAMATTNHWFSDLLLVDLWPWQQQIADS